VVLEMGDIQNVARKFGLDTIRLEMRRADETASSMLRRTLVESGTKQTTSTSALMSAFGVRV